MEYHNSTLNINLVFVRGLSNGQRAYLQPIRAIQFATAPSIYCIHVRHKQCCPVPSLGLAFVTESYLRILAHYYTVVISCFD